jgi:hypothetical protein
MGRFRFSIATLAFTVALIAVDIALIQDLFIHSRPMMVSVRYGLLMLNVLAIAAYRLWNAVGTHRPFLGGFVVSGLATALLCQAACLLAPETMYQWQARLALLVALKIHGFLPHFSSTETGRLSFKILFYAATIPPIAVVMGLPQLLVALVGGLINWSLPRRVTPNVAHQGADAPQSLPRSSSNP